MRDTSRSWLLALTVIWVPAFAGFSPAQDTPRKPPADKAILEIELPPGAKASIDGEDVGTGRRWTYGPFQPGQRHRCEVRVQFRDGGEARRTVYLQAGWHVHVPLLEPDASGVELVLQAGHTGAVQGVAFSPDSRYVATVSDDKSAVLWDAQTGQKLQTYLAHTGPVWSVAFSPDGKRLLTGSHDQSAVLWDVTTGKALRTFSGHANPVWSAAFSPDGQQILTGGGDLEAFLWDAQTGRKIRTFREDNVNGVAFSPDGRRVLTGLGNNAAVLWDRQTGQKLRTFQGHSERIQRVAFGPNGDKVLTSSIDKTAILWDVSSGQRLHTFPHAAAVTPVAVSPDGRQVLTGSADKTAVLWDAQSGAKVHSFAHADTVWAVAFSRDGKQVLTGSAGKTAVLWDARTGAKVRTFQGTVSAAAPRGPRPDGPPGLKWDERTPPSAAVFGVAFRPGAEQQVVLGSADGTAVLWDLRAGQKLRTFRGHTDAVKALAFSPDGAHLLTASWDKTAVLWDVATGQQLRTFRGHSDQIQDVAFSRDGRRIVTGSSDKTAAVWDAGSGQRLHALAGHTEKVNAVAFSLDGRLVCTGSMDKTAALWDADTGRHVGTLRGHTGEIESAVFSPDGRHVLTGSHDQHVLVWDVQTRREVRRLKEDADYSNANAIAFSAGGQLMCTGWCGNPATWWDMRTGQKLRTVHGHTSCVVAVALSGDGRLLLTGSRDGTARLWDLAAGDELARLISVDGGQDWLVVTSRGLFDGSAGGREKVSYRVGGGLNVVPVDRFFQDFYRPGLLAALWKGERPRPEVKLGAQRPPAIRIVAPAQGGPVEAEQVTLAVEVHDEGGGIQGPYLFHNGARVVASGKAERTEKTVRRTFSVALVHGENRLEVKAASGDGSWESEPARLVLRYEKALAKPTLHLLAVGVNRYAQEAMNLQFAAADAKAMADLFRRRGATLYRETNVVLLQDDRATKAGILQALEEIARRAKPADTLVVFLAGHGTMVGQRYFFIPHDFKRNEGTSQEEDIRRNALAVDVLGDAVGAVPALKRLLIFDTCQSGGAVAPRRTGRDPFAFRGEVERLSRSQGMFTLAAAAAGEEAQEVKELGHGVLSYALLAGLRAVDGGPLERQFVRPSGSDRVADVLEWFSFASAHVPRLTQKYFGREQDVQMSSQGSSFPLLPVEDR